MTTEELNIPDPEPPRDTVDVGWLRKLCQQYYRAGAKFGFEQGVKAMMDTEVSETSRIINPFERPS